MQLRHGGPCDGVEVPADASRGVVEVPLTQFRIAQYCACCGDFIGIYKLVTLRGGPFDKQRAIVSHPNSIPILVPLGESKEFAEYGSSMFAKYDTATGNYLGYTAD